MNDVVTFVVIVAVVALLAGAVGGFLTRLSGTGLANVTSGGGQVPAFVVTEK